MAVYGGVWRYVAHCEIGCGFVFFRLGQFARDVLGHRT
jgi:hypothetical protein